MQKISIYLLTATLLLGIQTRSFAQSNLVVNGDFETQITPPRGLSNIAGPNAMYDDLVGWHGIATADYLSTNAVNPQSNPQSTPADVSYGFPYCGAFSPHTGNGCVAIVREPYSRSHDQFITQQASGLILGHTYRASFYALRRPGHQGAEKLAFYVTASTPTYQGSSLSPAPYVTITSNPIADHINWTMVTGTFVAQSNNSYITIGYDRSLSAEDKSLYQYESINGDYYAIDDVSVVEIDPCDVVLNNYRPINFCSNQTNRPFGVRVPPAGFTFYWEFFRLNPNTGVFAPFYPRGLSSPYTATSTNPVLRVQGSQFPAGSTYNYRVRGRNDATGCYTAWSDFGEASGSSFTMEESCPSNPGEDEPGVVVVTDEDPKPSPPYMDSATSSPTAYPNPASDAITMPTDISEATLSSSQGNNVQRLDGTNKLDVRSLPNGLYNLQMRREGKLINQRIQVVH